MPHLLEPHSWHHWTRQSQPRKLSNVIAHKPIVFTPKTDFTFGNRCKINQRIHHDQTDFENPQKTSPEGFQAVESGISIRGGNSTSGLEAFRLSTKEVLVSSGRCRKKLRFSDRSVFLYIRLYWESDFVFWIIVVFWNCVNIWDISFIICWGLKLSRFARSFFRIIILKVGSIFDSFRLTMINII